MRIRIRAAAACLLSVVLAVPVARGSGAVSSAQGTFSYTITPLTSQTQSWPEIDFQAPYFYYYLTNTSAQPDSFRMRVVNSTEPDWFEQVCVRQVCFPDSGKVKLNAFASDTIGVNIVPLFDGVGEADFIVNSVGDPSLSNTFHVMLFAGTFAVSANSVPREPSLRLAQNFPNPALGGTRIPFALPRSERVTLRIFDAAGRVVVTLVDRTLAAGTHSVEWDGYVAPGRRAPGGVYFYRLESKSGSRSKRMILLR
jgi:hypothetical protein